MPRHRLAPAAACLLAALAAALPAAAAAKPVKTAAGHVTVAPAHSVKPAQTIHGGATGTGPATNEDCEQYANIIANRATLATQAADAGDIDTASSLFGEADKYMDQGENAGCFFYWVP